MRTVRDARSKFRENLDNLLLTRDGVANSENHVLFS